jgi:hypothetical protein
VGTTRNCEQVIQILLDYKARQQEPGTENGQVGGSVSTEQNGEADEIRKGKGIRDEVAARGSSP